MGARGKDDKAHLEEGSVEVNGIQVKPGSTELRSAAKHTAVGEQASGDQWIDIGC